MLSCRRLQIVAFLVCCSFSAQTRPFPIFQHYPGFTAHSFLERRFRGSSLNIVNRRASFKFNWWKIDAKVVQVEGNFDKWNPRRRKLEWTGSERDGTNDLPRRGPSKKVSGENGVAFVSCNFFFVNNARMVQLGFQMFVSMGSVGD